MSIKNDTFNGSGKNGGGDQLKEKIEQIDHIDANRSKAVNLISKPDKRLKRRSLTLNDLGTRSKHDSRIPIRKKNKSTSSKLLDTPRQRKLQLYKLKNQVQQLKIQKTRFSSKYEDCAHKLSLMQTRVCKLITELKRQQHNEQLLKNDPGTKLKILMQEHCLQEQEINSSHIYQVAEQLAAKLKRIEDELKLANSEKQSAIKEADKIKYEQDVLKQQITDNVKNEAELKEILRNIKENLFQCENKRFWLVLENDELQTQLERSDERVEMLDKQLNMSLSQLIKARLKKKLFGPQDQEERQNNNGNNHLTDEPKKKIISTIARISLQIFFHFALMTVPALTPTI